MSKITYVNLGDLKPPEFQAHSNTSPEHIHEIAESIKILGVIEPLIIRKTKQGLEIVAGFIRYLAAISAGLKAVPCIIMSLGPKESEILKLHENVKRIPLDHVDQGHTFRMMQETFEMTEKDISESSGKSVPYISQHIALVRLKNELTSAVKDGSITFYQARELMRVDNKSERKRLLMLCQESGVIVSVLRGWVNEYLRDLEISPSSHVDIPEQISDHNTPKISHICEACDKPIKTSEIMQVIYCPPCHKAIKDAISDEKNKRSQNTPEKDS